MKFRFGLTALFLLLANLFAILVALWQRWDLADVMWIYWGQSLIIGYYNVRRILCLKEFSTDGFTINDQPVEPTKATQRQTALFFALHFGGFHFIYFVFLLSEWADPARFNVLAVAACIAVFWFNHGFSFRRNLADDLSWKPNIGHIMAFPYARIIPMHLTILFGGWFAKDSPIALVLFLGLKTVADVIMHLVEHGRSDPRGQA